MAGSDAIHRGLPASILALLALAGGSPATGEGEVLLPDPSTRFVHQQWTVEDGLPVNTLNDVVQTPDGWLWIASFDGLLRFDGVRFTRFDTQGVPELASNRIVELELGAGGTLWILPERGHPTRWAEGRFHAIALPAGAVVENARMAIDDDGVPWLLTNHDLFRMAGDRLVESAVDFGGHRPGRIAAGAAGRIWLHVKGPRPFAVVEHGQARWLDVGLPSSENVEYLAGDAAGALWIGTVGRLWRWHRGVLAEVAGRRTPPGSGARAWPSPAAASGAGEPMLRWTEGRVRRFLKRDPSGAVWEAAGASLWRAGQRVLSLPVSGRGIRALTFDHEGTAWIATDTQGLHALLPSRVTALAETEGLVEGNVYALHQDRRGTFWIGGATGALHRVRAAAVAGGLAIGVEPVAVTPAPEIVAHGLGDRTEPLAIYDDPGSGLLLIGGPGALYRVAGERRLPLADMTASIPGQDLWDGAVRAIHRARDGRLLVGHRYGLLASRPDDPGADGWRFARVAGTAGMRVRAILEGPDGEVWLGTDGAGVARVQDGRVTRVTTAEGLSSDRVRALHLDPRGHLWIATEDRGLVRLVPATLTRKRGPEVAVIQKRDGLWDDGLHKILEDDAGWLWLSTNRGIFRVLRAQLEDFVAGLVPRVDSIVYTEADGMRHREANGGIQDAGLRARDGRLWFATQDGVAILDPASLVGLGVPPPVHVERLGAGDVEVGVAGGAAALEPRQASFEIAYTALSFRSPERVRFRYRLGGYDEGWIEAGGRRRAFYTKVPPGRYAFEVQARSADGVWNRQGATLALTVHPFFYETAWFRGAVMLALLAAVAGGFVQRERRQRALTRRLEEQVTERTAELARERDVVADQAARLAELDRAKSELFANVSHEFRTPLTLSLGPLEDLIEGCFGPLEPAVTRELEGVRANSARLLELVGQLLDVARLDAGGLTLRIARGDLGRATRRIGERFVSLAERRRIDFAVSVPAAPAWACFDLEQLDKVLTNLLSNAFKFTPGGGRVTLILEPPAGGWAEIAVGDSGRGLEREELPRIFDRFYRAESAARRQVPGTGLGLALARDLVELHGGTLEVESVLGQGSTFRVRLPLDAGGALPEEPRASRAEAAAGEASGTAALAGSLFEAARTHEAGEGRDAGDSPDDESTEITDVTTVLVVDDHPELRAYVCRHLDRRYRVIEAADGAEALAKARRVLPDLVVSDVMMPEMDGFELTRVLKQDPELDFVPVVLLTARAEAEDKLAGLGIGADDYLTKPFDVRELVVRVDNLIASRRRLRECFAGAPPPPPALPLAPGVKPTGDDRDFLRRVRESLRDGVAEEGFNVEALAGCLHLDRSHLFRRLRELTGTAPSSLILEARMKRAAELLERDDGGVGEVAVAVGFKSVAHFSQRFRARYGVAPSAYRAGRASASA